MNEYEVGIAPDRGGVWTRIVVMANRHSEAHQIGENMYRGVGKVMFVTQLTYTEQDRKRRAAGRG